VQSRDPDNLYVQWTNASIITKKQSANSDIHNDFTKPEAAVSGVGIFGTSELTAKH
jgi:hypothetical protein